MRTLKLLGACAAVMGMSVMGAANAALTVSASTSATDLVNTLVGSGISTSNATLSVASSTAAGTFAGGNSVSLGIDSGVLLTTGTVTCAPGPNTSASCTGAGTTTSLKFDFTTGSGNLFFNYVFASEEYNEYVGSGFNDSFQLLLDGVNIALVPNGGGVVSINNVNNNVNSAYYVSNSSPNNSNLDIQYDGLTTVLQAAVSGLTAGVHTFEFLIADVGDSSWDSGVFIQAGSFSDTSVPEPTSLALLGLGLGFVGMARKYRKS